MLEIFAAPHKSRWVLVGVCKAGAYWRVSCALMLGMVEGIGSGH